MRRAEGSGRRLAAGALVTVLVAAFLPVATAPAWADSGYPSWNDVQAAKASQAATQAEVDTINTLLVGLQGAANAASVEAIKRTAAAAQAQANLAVATQRADALASQVAQATASAASLEKRSGLLTEQLVRFGGPDPSLTLFLDGTSSGTLLYQLGAVSRLTTQAVGLGDAATAQRNLARSLSGQAEAARTVRDGLAAAAQASLAAAQLAQQAADAQLATQQKNGTVLYAQLAALKNTTAAVEQKYAEGVAAALAYQNASSGTGSADSFAPPPGVVVDPAAAQAYASGAIGAYGWGGDQMTCLVWLWNKESGWRADAYNTSSGAYGIPQALPAEKLSAAGADWATNANTQINWGLGYISSRYGSPCGAWSHEMAHNWY